MRFPNIEAAIIALAVFGGCEESSLLGRKPEMKYSKVASRKESATTRVK